MYFKSYNTLLLITWILNGVSFITGTGFFIFSIGSMVLSIIMLVYMSKMADPRIAQMTKAANITNICVNGFIVFIAPVSWGLTMFFIGFFMFGFKALLALGMGIWMLIIWLNMNKLENVQEFDGTYTNVRNNTDNI